MEKVYPDPDYRQKAFEYMKESSVEWKEFILKSKSGKDVLSEWSNIRLDDGTQIGIGIDVTERKEAARSLASSESAIRALLNATPDALFLIDPEGIVYALNTETRKRLDLKEDEIIGKCIWDFVPAEVVNFRKPRVEEVVKTRQPAIFEDMRAGRHILNSLYPVFDVSGNVSRLAVYGSDITDVKESEDRFKKFFELAPMPYQSLDENGNFIEVNKSWLGVLEYTREEVLGKNFGDFIHPDWAEHFKENFPRFKAIGEILGVEFEMLKKDGTTILVSFNGKINKDDQGNFERTQCIFHDITAIKTAEDSLRSIIQEKETLLKELNHRVKNNMQVKIGRASCRERV